jgi:signal peptidase I
MQPTFSAGDLVVTQPVLFSVVYPGDVIAFFPDVATRTPVIHRVVAFDDGVMTTKGDANSIQDPWRLAPAPSATAYRLVFVVPFVGWLSQFKVPLLLLALVFAALAVVQIGWKEVAKRRVPQLKPVP